MHAKRRAVYATSMPNQRSLDKINLNAWVTCYLFSKVEKLALKRGESVTNTLIQELTHATSSIELSPEDNELIARQLRQEVARRKKKSPLVKPGNGPKTENGDR